MVLCFPRRYVAGEDSYLVVTTLDGRTAYLDGPISIFRNPFVHDHIRVVAHERHVANSEQCVEVLRLDGRLERHHGPCCITLDPLVHKCISVKPHVRHVADANQYLLVQLRSGERQVLCGPSSLLFDPDVHLDIVVRPLKRHIADQSQYLVVQHLDGVREHLRGPVELCEDPFRHARIETLEAVKLAANECVVVYRRQPVFAELLAKTELVPNKKTSKAKMPDVSEPGGRPQVLAAERTETGGAVHVERRVVHGPAVFMPNSEEWLHTFSWHGTKTKDGKGSKTGWAGDEKTPHALSFQVLRCMPDNMYYSVRDVRTHDDALITVHLMLFYELRDIETMLDGTNDLLGDFINAASADVMTFAASRTYERFLEDTAMLSETAQFPILGGRMEQTGSVLLKVVYRGYSASMALQEMHDEAISRRTRMRLESDGAREQEEQRAMALNARQQRSVQEQELKAAEERHALELQTMQREQERRMKDEEHAATLRYERERAQAELATERARYEEEQKREHEAAALARKRLADEREEAVAKLRAMHDLGVDLTQYLVASQAPRPDHLLKIDAPTVASGTSNAEGPSSVKIKVSNDVTANGRANGISNGHAHAATS